MLWRTCLAIAVLATLAAVVCFVAAIWTDGPGTDYLSRHLGRTGVLAVLIAIVAGCTAGTAHDIAKTRAGR